MGVYAQRMRSRVGVGRRDNLAALVVFGLALAAVPVRAGIPPPTFTKAFGAVSIPISGVTSLTFTVGSAGATYSGIAFSDTLPAGLAIATPNGLTDSCGGTATAVAGSTTISLTGGALAGPGSCTVVVNVVGVTAGTKNNVSGAISTTQTGASTTANASINVDGPPAIAKAFSPTEIAAGGTSLLTITITNPASNPDAATGVAVIDTYPSGIVGPVGSAPFCGGTLTGTASSLTLTGATVVTGSPCGFAVTVSAASPGTYVNTTGTVSSTNGGTGSTATASLLVDPVVPVMTPWILSLVGALLMGVAVLVMRRRRLA